MPPRHTYWTIILEGKPTAFRAHTQEELLPTLKQLQSKHPDAVMKWFARGSCGTRLKRSAGIRAKRASEKRRPVAPGGEHRDPRDQFKVPRDEKRRRLRRTCADRPWAPNPRPTRGEGRRLRQGQRPNRRRQRGEAPGALDSEGRPQKPGMVRRGARTPAAGRSPTEGRTHARLGAAGEAGRWSGRRGSGGPGGPANTGQRGQAGSGHRQFMAPGGPSGRAAWRGRRRSVRGRRPPGGSRPGGSRPGGYRPAAKTWAATGGGGRGPGGAGPRSRQSAAAVAAQADIETGSGGRDDDRARRCSSRRRPDLPEAQRARNRPRGLAAAAAIPAIRRFRLGTRVHARTARVRAADPRASTSSPSMHRVRRHGRRCRAYLAHPAHRALGDLLHAASAERVARVRLRSRRMPRRRRSRASGTTRRQRRRPKKKSSMTSRSCGIDSAALIATRRCEPLSSPFVYHELSARSLLITQRS